MRPKITWQKFLGHWKTVRLHRKWARYYCRIAGIRWRGLKHDLSKYSPTEFFESVKYFDGHRSPIIHCKADKGYSKAWLHHKGRNKHHLEYWEDVFKGEKIAAFIPYKYIVESICDKLAATKAYNGKNFNETMPLEYWERVDKKNPTKVHPGIVEFIDTVLAKIAEDGINAGLKPKYLKQTYNTIKNKHIKKNKS